MATDPQKQKRLQESLLQAVQTVVSQAVSTQQWDQTLVGTIIACKSALTGEYVVNCNGGKISAFTRDGEEYKSNERVYVQVPQGNFNNTKYIIGKASMIDNDANITFVNSLLNSYNMIGRNLLDNEDKLWINNQINSTGQKVKGLNSFKARDGGFIYYNVEDWEREDATLVNLITAIDELNNNNQMLDFNQEEFRNYMNSAEALMIEGSFQTRLNKAHKSSATGHYGLAFTLAFRNRDAELKDNINDYSQSEIEYRTFTLDSFKMTGNPLQYENKIDQYAVFGIDKDNFLFLKSIEVYSEGFEEEDDNINIQLWGNDIFITQPEIYALRTITATNGDYTLRLSTPSGATFKTNNTTEILTARADVFYKNTNFSDQTSYYWFYKDDRVRAGSDGYHMYGGAGWRYLKEKNTNYILETSGAENKAYENKYLVVGVYKQTVVLKQEFSLYNEANLRDIIIESDLGNVFSFDRGIPQLTCKIRNKEDSEFREDNFDNTGRYPDDYYSFYWSIMTSDGQVLLFERTAEEIEEELSNFSLGNVSFSTISALRQELANMEDVTFEKGIHGNKLSYPVKKIRDSLTVSCSVFRKEASSGIDYPLGTVSLFLKNQDAATEGYTIMIVNGDQHFQYDEYGTSPVAEKNLFPQEILPLSIIFYDPAGQKVNENTYSVKWKIPLDTSLINISNEMKKNLLTNPANNLAEWYPYKDFPLTIAEYFNYSAISNSQLTAIITYDGQIYERDTDFVFEKIGDNGTNGTDVTAKIVVSEQGSLNPKYMLGINTTKLENPTWNNGMQFANSPLEMQVRQRNEILQNESVQWGIAGNSYNSKHYKIENSFSPIISWNNEYDSYNSMPNNLIVRAMERKSYEGKVYEYYAFLGIPLVSKNSSVIRNVWFNRRECTQEVTYNAAGLFPMYDTSTGLSIVTENTGQYLTLMVEGGMKVVDGSRYYNNNDTAGFRLFTYKEGKIPKDDGSFDKEEPKLKINTIIENNHYKCYILPNDAFDGEWTNNVIHGKIYANAADQRDDIPQIEFWYPIYMHLNTFGLKSLNAWDGNRIEINEDENYILAPQIGAGEKDTNNRFTGIVMGAAKDYHQSQKQDSTEMLGLLGYSHGKQSIWLDAETGNATFGLPEELGDSNNGFTEGQIKLVPGGESTIGRWTIGSDFIANVRTKDGFSTPLGGRYRDKYAQDHKRDIGHKDHGVLLSAEPGYLSIKTRELTDEDLPQNSSNKVVNFETDAENSFELQIDPNQRAFFTLWHHYHPVNENDNWKRRMLVFIDENGRFCSNALKDSSAGVNMGPIGAFGFSADAATARYLGANFEVGRSNEETGEIEHNSSLFKVFTDRNNGEPTNSSTVYLSAGSTTSNEYGRALSMHFRSFDLYAGSSGNSKTTSSSIELTTQNFKAQINNSNFSLDNGNANINAGAVTATGSNVTLNGSSEINLNGGSLKLIGSGYTLTSTGNVIETVTGNYTSSANNYNYNGNTSFIVNAANNVANLTLGSANSILKNNSSLLTLNNTSATLQTSGGIASLTSNYTVTVSSGMVNMNAKGSSLVLSESGSGITGNGVTFSSKSNVSAPTGTGASGFESTGALSARQGMFTSTQAGVNAGVYANTGTFLSQLFAGSNFSGGGANDNGHMGASIVARKIYCTDVRVTDGNVWSDGYCGGSSYAFGSEFIFYEDDHTPKDYKTEYNGKHLSALLKDLYGKISNIENNYAKKTDLNDYAKTSALNDYHKTADFTSWVNNTYKNHTHSYVHAQSGEGISLVQATTGKP